MTKRLLLICLAFATILSAGCLFSRKTAKPKDTTITSEVESPYRQRWIDRRTAELVGQGKTADVARAQATDEFQAQFGSVGSRQK